MSNPDPTKPKSNDQKFKPSNVADEKHGNIKGGGRKGRNMGNDVLRGSTNQSHTGQR